MPEIERKWLVPTLPADLPKEGSLIHQGYLALGEDEEVRLRDKAGAYTLTTKRGTGLVRDERESIIPKAVFDTQWPLTAGRRLEKWRHAMPYGEALLEIDRYAGALAPLVVVEVEFTSEAAARAFRVPAWFGAEVTEDARYKNRALAVHGRPG